MATVTFQGTPVQLGGELPRTGTLAPEFGGVKGDLSVAHLSDFKGKKVILNIFPSLDTPTCALSVRHFNAEAASFENTVVLCISKDLPFAQSRFCSTEGLDRVIPLSVFRSEDFEKNYGLVITEGPMMGLTSRAVIVIDETGKIIYRQLIKNVSDEPDYQKAIEQLR